MSSTSLSGLVLCITGASSGIGAELARQSAHRKARLVLAARDAHRLESIAAECRSVGAQVLVVPTDVSREEDCRAMIDATIAHYGQLDILINNAGLGASGLFREITDRSVFERVMRVNFLGSVWCTSYALPHLETTRGRIVAIASLTALTGVPKRTAYGASKHAMAGFFDSLRIELAHTGVSVTVVYPGFVYSDINTHALSPDGTPWGDRAYKRHADEVMRTDECARRILDATAGRNRDLVMTWRGKIGRILKLISPSLIDRMAKRVIEGKQ